MPPNRHALLSASSSHRWLNCNPSARLEQEFADRETEVAAEGTAAHALCEHKLRKALNADAIGGFLFALSERDDALTEFDDRLWLTVLDRVIAHADGRLVFRFQNGAEVES